MFSLAINSFQWNQVALDAKNYGFGAIRIEGFDCNALDLVSSAAAGQGPNVMAGIYVTLSESNHHCVVLCLVLIGRGLQGSITNSITQIK